MEEILDQLKKMGIGILIFFYTAISWGFLMYKLWYWFILPIFPALPQLDYRQCMSLILIVVVLITPSVGMPKQKEDIGIITVILIPWVFFVFCWLFKIIFL